MAQVSLLNSTGNAGVDQILQGIIELIERRFPQRVRADYVTGSYADGTALAASDLDSIELSRSFGRVLWL